LPPHFIGILSVFCKLSDTGPAALIAQIAQADCAIARAALRGNGALLRGAMLV
jgi:hypothetical protein